MRNDENYELIFIVILTIFLVGFFVCLNAFLIMIAWNFVMPYLFHLPQIGFLRALTVAFLLSIVTGAIKRK